MKHKYETKNGFIYIKLKYEKKRTPFPPVASIVVGENIFHAYIFVDFKGRFIIYKKEKIYLKDWVKLNYAEFFSLLERKEASVNDLYRMMATEKPENLLIYNSIMSNNILDPDTEIPIYRISEETYKIEEMSKIELNLIDTNGELKKDVFLCEAFFKYIQSGFIKIIKVKEVIYDI